MEYGGWNARSAVECRGKGGEPPLSGLAAFEPKGGRCRAVPTHSKIWLLLLVLPAAFCLRAWGQSYSIDWYRISGGGGTSTGATYQVSGAIGQPEAGGAMSGGQYS